MIEVGSFIAGAIGGYIGGYVSGAEESVNPITADDLQPITTDDGLIIYIG